MRKCHAAPYMLCRTGNVMRCTEERAAVMSLHHRVQTCKKRWRLACVNSPLLPARGSQEGDSRNLAFAFSCMSVQWRSETTPAPATAGASVPKCHVFSRDSGKNAAQGGAQRQFLKRPEGTTFLGNKSSLNGFGRYLKYFPINSDQNQPTNANFKTPYR